jgi:aldehyde oxidase/xanthine dehydrogenase-like protein
MFIGFEGVRPRLTPRTWATFPCGFLPAVVLAHLQTAPSRPRPLPVGPQDSRHARSGVRAQHAGPRDDKPPRRRDSAPGPGRGCGVHTPERLQRELNPMDRVHRIPLLPIFRVSYVGQPVAMVVAESRYAAMDAAELVDVEYEPLPVVTDPTAAPGAGRTARRAGLAGQPRTVARVVRIALPDSDRARRRPMFGFSIRRNPPACPACGRART